MRNDAITQEEDCEAKESDESCKEHKDKVSAGRAGMYATRAELRRRLRERSDRDDQ